ncbi:MAG: AsmA-like C-terminal domain-containing protein, partial [Maricaulaceae bacterium]
IGNIQSPLKGFLRERTDFDVNLSSLFVDRTPQFNAPFRLEDIALTGTYDRNKRRAIFSQIYADFGRFQPDFSGSLAHEKDGKLSEFKLDGPINGTLIPKDVLALWPPKAAKGARDWIKRSALGGRLENVNLSLDLDAEDFAQLPPLPRDSAKLSFDYKDGTVLYISTMTPANEVNGSGILYGNSGEFVLESGKVGEVILTQGAIDIPVFFPKGGDLNIDVDGIGPVSELVDLIDQKPFEYARPYGVKPEEFSGTGTINLKVTRPLLVNFDRNRIAYTVSGRMEDVSAPFGVGPHKLRGGNVTLYADKNGLVMKGLAHIGPWPTLVSWREVFDEGATPTLYSASGLVDRDTLDGFGIGLREYIGGEIQLNIDARARGLEITGADVTADLTQTEMRLGPYWSKPLGEAGRMTGKLSRTENGRVQLRDINVTSPGLSLKGGIDMAGNFRLINMDFSQAKIDNFIDAALEVKPGENGEKFDVFLTGDYLDVSPFVSGMFNTQSNAFDVPILLTASLRRLALNEAYSLRDSNVLFAHDGVGIRQARLKGETLDGSLVIDITTDDEAGFRNIDIDVPSASEAAYAFMNMSSLIGGRMQIKGTMPIVGEVGPMSGEAFVEDITVVNAPAMTTLLSLASLKGLSDAMTGEGLKFQSLTVPFSLEDQVLSMRDARASGPALGMTSNGEISFADKTLDLDGVLVPAYTANSMLGDIPVIGDIFVGKKGEGIFALSYSMRGPFKKSQVSVNPLSALTPGFLRGIFRQKRDALPPSVESAIKEIAPKGEGGVPAEPE